MASHTQSRSSRGYANRMCLDITGTRLDTPFAVVQKQSAVRLYAVCCRLVGARAAGKICRKYNIEEGNTLWGHVEVGGGCSEHD